MRQDIIDTFAKHNNLILKGVTPENNCIFMPYILMDVVLQIYQHEIKTAPLKFMANHWKKEMRRAYNRFNLPFFKPFSINQADAIGDTMEEFENYIAPELRDMKKSIVDQLSDINFTQREICAACIVCNIFARESERQWERYYDQKVFGKNKHLIDVMEYSYKIIELTCPKAVDTVPDPVVLGRLGKKIVKWTFEGPKELDW